MGLVSVSAVSAVLVSVAGASSSKLSGSQSRRSSAVPGVSWLTASVSPGSWASMASACSRNAVASVQRDGSSAQDSVGLLLGVAAAGRAVGAFQDGGGPPAGVCGHYGGAIGAEGLEYAKQVLCLVAADGCLQQLGQLLLGHGDVRWGGLLCGHGCTSRDSKFQGCWCRPLASGPGAAGNGLCRQCSGRENGVRGPSTPGRCQCSCQC